MRKILVSAYGCEPYRGSEAGVGWNWILQMARFNELFVIARKNDKEKIEKNLPNEYENTVHFFYYDTCPFLQKIKKKEKGLYLYYWLWQIGIIPFIAKIIHDYKPDYTMHLTFGSLWMPTFLPFFNVPFIWGPIGGGDGVPKKLLSILPLKQRFIQSMRYVMIATSWLNPLVVIPSKKACLILCRTENNRDAIPKKYRHKCRVVLETAMEDEVFANCKDYDKISDYVKIIVTGRLVPFKNIMLALECIDTLIKEHQKIHMSIIGKGSEENKINTYIQKHGLETVVDLIPEMPRDQLLKRLSDADIYFFPSLREGGSWALMEAMAVGLPVVCLNWTGMKIITDTNSAIQIEPNEYEQIKCEFTEGLSQLIIDRELRISMVSAARKRIKNLFNWEHVGNQFNKILNQCEMM